MGRETLRVQEMRQVERKGVKMGQPEKRGVKTGQVERRELGREEEMETEAVRSEEAQDLWQREEMGQAWVTSPPSPPPPAVSPRSSLRVSEWVSGCGRLALLAWAALPLCERGKT